MLPLLRVYSHKGITGHGWYGRVTWLKCPLAGLHGPMMEQRRCQRGLWLDANL